MFTELNFILENFYYSLHSNEQVDWGQYGDDAIGVGIDKYSSPTLPSFFNDSWRPHQGRNPGSEEQGAYDVAARGQFEATEKGLKVWRSL